MNEIRYDPDPERWQANLHEGEGRQTYPDPRFLVPVVAERPLGFSLRVQYRLTPDLWADWGVFRRGFLTLSPSRN